MHTSRCPAHCRAQGLSRRRFLETGAWMVGSALAAGFAVLSFSLPAAAGQAGKGAIQVFILAGQSNMEGHGKVEGRKDGKIQKGTLRYVVTDPKTADRYAHLVAANGQWRVRKDVWVAYNGGNRHGPLTVGYGGNKNEIGPEFGFGHVVGWALGEQVLLIKFACGGASLAGHFRPPSSGGKVGPGYTAILSHVRKVMGNLKTLFHSYDGRACELAGFGWHQGWNDGCGWADTKEYEANLANLIRDVRKVFGVEDMPFVIANSGFGGRKQTNARRLAIMKAQAAVPEREEFRGNVITVETRDFFRPHEVSPSGQRYHWNHNGETHYLIGEAMGKAMLKLLKQNGSQPRPRTTERTR